MKWSRAFCLMIVACGITGCAQKTTKKVTVETPEKKYEVEVEKTERK